MDIANIDWDLIGEAFHSLKYGKKAQSDQAYCRALCLQQHDENLAVPGPRGMPPLPGAL
jgi:hypothetical protein